MNPTFWKKIGLKFFSKSSENSQNNLKKYRQKMRQKLPIFSSKFLSKAREFIGQAIYVLTGSKVQNGGTKVEPKRQQNVA